jgi:hypothetical protein
MYCSAVLAKHAAHSMTSSEKRAQFLQLPDAVPVNHRSVSEFCSLCADGTEADRRRQRIWAGS